LLEKRYDRYHHQGARRDDTQTALDWFKAAMAGRRRVD
jgi:hypothetical protein